MANNYFKPKGIAKASKPDAGGGVLRSLPVLGVVKNNIDPTHGGRLQVYVADFGAPNPDDSSSWTTVGMMVPFFGATSGSGATTGFGTFTQNPVSYGMWYSPPDIGSTVVCIFINGDPSYGYYIGSVPTPEELQMVPAIGATTNVLMNPGEAAGYGGATQLPVANLNNNNTAVADGPGFLNAPKPVHSYAAAIYTQQGLLRDTIRGPITSSALRESPSRVGWGVNTPGRPIFEGGFTDANILDNLKDSPKLKLISRRGGHSIVMDDGDNIGKDQVVRIRTALGHQILMSDDGQCLHIIHSNGQSWIELGKEGTIDMYSTNSVNIRTQGDLNLHADNNININAKKDLNIAAENININAEKNTKVRVGAAFNTYVMGQYTVKADGAMSMLTSSIGSYAAASTMFVNGSIVNLNTGSTSATPQEVQPVPIVAHTDTLGDATKGFAAAPGKLLSVVSRAPAHAPWSNANQGVDVKTTTSASQALPKPPTPAVAAANFATATAPATPVTPAVAATVPASAAVSLALDKNVTSTMVGAVAANAAAAAPSVVKTGTGTVTDAVGQTVAAVGSLALPAKMLEAAGVLKSGSAALINGIVAGGGTVTAAMTENLFTGIPGAENLTALVKNIPAQVTVQVTNFQQSQVALTKVGAITGNEAPGQIAGVVMSGAQAGIPATTSFIKNALASAGSIASSAGSLLASAGSGLIGGASNLLSSATSAVTKAMSSGNFAANLGSTVTGGLGSIVTSLTGIAKSSAPGLSGLLSSAKGVAGSAFAAITASFKPFAAGVPQNLTAIAKKNTEEAAAAAGEVAATAASIPGADSLQSTANSAIASATTVAGINRLSIGKTLSAITGSVGSTASGLLSSATKAATGIFSSVGSTVASIAGKFSIGSSLPSASSIASGVNGLPGGAGAVSSIVNGATGAARQLPGVADISSAVTNASTAAINGVSGAVTAASKLAGPSVAGLGNAINSAVAGVNVAGITNQINSGTQTLSALAALGLPAGEAAKLSAAISSIGSGGPFQIKMPTVAEGTLDRSEVTALTSTLLGNPKIPAPNFTGGVSSSAQTAMQEFDKWRISVEKAQTEQIAANDLSAAAIAAFQNAKNQLPAGDPQIDELKLAAQIAVNKQIALGDIAGKLLDNPPV